VEPRLPLPAAPPSRDLVSHDSRRQISDRGSPTACGWRCGGGLARSHGRRSRARPGSQATRRGWRRGRAAPWRRRLGAGLQAELRGGGVVTPSWPQGVSAMAALGWEGRQGGWGCDSWERERARVRVGLAYLPLWSIRTRCFTAAARYRRRPCGAAGHGAAACADRGLPPEERSATTWTATSD